MSERTLAEEWAAQADAWVRPSPRPVPDSGGDLATMRRHVESRSAAGARRGGGAAVGGRGRGGGRRAVVWKQASPCGHRRPKGAAPAAEAKTEAPAPAEG